MKKVEIFADHGSTDDADVLVKYAFFKLMKYYPNRFLYSIAFILSLGMGAAPLLMNVFIGEMVDSLMPGKDFFDTFLPVLYKIIYFIVGFVVVCFFSALFVPMTNRRFIRKSDETRYRIFRPNDDRSADW